MSSVSAAGRGRPPTTLAGVWARCRSRAAAESASGYYSAPRDACRAAKPPRVVSAWGRIILLALASAGILAGCGGSDEIPQDTANTLLQRLDEVESAVSDGNCEGAQASADLLQEQVGDGERSLLPADVDPEVRDLLQDGAARLVQLVNDQCEPAAEPEPEPEPVEPAPPPPPEPPEDDLDDEEEAEPPDDDDDRDEGNRGGGQGGGGQGGGNSDGGSGAGSPTGGADGGTRAGG